MNQDEVFALTPIMTLAAVIVAVMLAIAIKRSYLATAVLSASGIFITLLTLVCVWPEVPVQVTPLLLMDRYALFFIGLILLAGLAVLGFCYDYFKGREGENEELFLLMLTALFGASVLVSSSHFASFFLGLEILSISLFTLVGYPVKQTKPLEAAIKYLVLSGVSSALLLMGMALIYAQSGKLSFNEIMQWMTSQPDANAMILGGIVLIISGIGFKLSLVPFHLWTPDVYEGAPAPVTAFIATVSKGAVFVLLLRFFLGTGGYIYKPLLTIFSLIAVLTILAGNLLALLQSNVKRLLAYSSIAHLGYLLVPFIACAGHIFPLALEASVFYLAVYLMTTIGAFGVVSMLSTSPLEAGDISLYQGLFWRRQWLSGFFALMLLSLAGIPLTAGFIAKFYIFTSGSEARLWMLLIAVILGSALGLYYYLKLIAVMAMKQVLSEKEIEILGNNDKLSLAILSFLGITTLWLGVSPAQFITFVQLIANTMN